MSENSDVGRWRLVLTDSESTSGVAPTCPRQEDEHGDYDVQDCCPGPHIECWTPSNALVVLDALSYAHAELCS